MKTFLFNFNKAVSKKWKADSCKKLLYIAVIYLTAISLRALAMNARPSNQTSLSAKIKNELSVCPVSPPAKNCLREHNEKYLCDFQDSSLMESLNLPAILRLDTRPFCSSPVTSPNDGKNES